MKDGKTFVIVIKVIERKFEKGKMCFTQLECVVKGLKLFFSERNIIIYNCITVKENAHTGSYFIKKINE